MNFALALANILEVKKYILYDFKALRFEWKMITLILYSIVIHA